MRKENSISSRLEPTPAFYLYQAWELGRDSRNYADFSAVRTISEIRVNPLRKYFGICRGVGGVLVWDQNFLI